MIVEAVGVMGAFRHDSSLVFELHSAPMDPFLFRVVGFAVIGILCHLNSLVKGQVGGEADSIYLLLGVTLLVRA